jgi:hypothetical protein
MREIARAVMGTVKDYVIRGIYYDSIGVKDYGTWTNMILDDFGPDTRRYIRDIRKWSILLQQTADDGKNKKINCWEFMGCGLYAKRNSALSSSSGTCPAALEKRFDGMHGGMNAGRACWVIPHTMCGNTIQGAFEEKCGVCMTCDFYISVLEEEGNTALCFPV